MKDTVSLARSHEVLVLISDSKDQLSSALRSLVDFERASGRKYSQLVIMYGTKGSREILDSGIPMVPKRMWQSPVILRDTTEESLKMILQDASAGCFEDIVLLAENPEFEKEVVNKFIYERPRIKRVDLADVCTPDLEESKSTETLCDLLFSPLNRSNEVYRYSSVYQESRESLAEHITEVSILSYMIASEMVRRGCQVDIKDLLEKCLFHDIDEVLTGDIPRNTKYASESAHENLSKVARAAVIKIQEVSRIPSLERIWSQSKWGKVGLILRISDMLCVVRKCIVEIKLRGNLSFLKVAAELVTHLDNLLKSHEKDFCDLGSSGTYLKTLVEGSRKEVRKILEESREETLSYHIKDLII